ncbi:MAG TPA: FCD domain-containing protein, partial [Solirubrobacteraceae bacterium]|nr:FCD domain-containing protein [Solirubrobacteraceae bacterium]
ARRVLLVEAARLAAQRRSDGQARSLEELAGAIAAAEDDSVRLAVDWEFMATLVEASGNLVFQLIMNSVRELYLPHAQAFVAIVARGESGAEPYARAAVAVVARDADAAASAIEMLVTAQARAVLR